MNKTTFLLFLLLLGTSNLVFSNQNEPNISIHIKKRKLCKTWYVTQVFEIREGREDKIKTSQIEGSSFTFNKDYTFEFIDKIRNKTLNGSWKQLDKNSFSVDVENNSLDFEIIKLTKDSLYIIGTENKMDSKKMHFKFCSTFSNSKNKKSTNIKSISKMEEMETAPLHIFSLGYSIIENNSSKPKQNTGYKTEKTEYNTVNNWVLQLVFTKNGNSTLVNNTELACNKKNGALTYFSKPIKTN